MAIRPPKVVLVSAHAAIKIDAPGAAALAHSASRIASPSLSGTTPGAAQLFPGCEGGAGGCTCVKEAEVYPERPKVCPKFPQAEALKKTRSSNKPMGWPLAEIPAPK